jgi:hypothetical protein
MSKLIKPQYTLQIFSQKMNSPQAYLEDKYLKTSQLLVMNDTNRILFNVTADAVSFDANRFRIVFGKSDLPPVITAKRSGIHVFPNPVRGQKIHLQLNEIEKGQYILRLINSLGQKMHSQLIDHDGTSISMDIPLNKKYPQGMYYLQLSGKEKYTQTIFIE